MRWLKQSTSVDVPIGPFLDATDGVTAETSLTITQPDIRLKKNGGNWAQKNAAQTLSHEENGNYEVTLDTTDTNTLGLLRLHVAESGALPVWEDFMVVPANVWDSLFGADLLQVDLTQWLGTAAATPTVAGVPEIDVTHWNGTAVATPDTAGYPKVTHKTGSGTGEVLLRSGEVQTTLTGRRFTAQAGGSSTITLDAGASSVTDFYAGWICATKENTGAGQVNVVSTYNGTTKVATMVNAWKTNPDSSTIAELFPLGYVPIEPVDLFDTATGSPAAGSYGERITRIPNADAGTNGGLPTVNGSNYIAGMQGTINTLDALDTAQDSQHSTTQTAIGDLPTNAELATALGTADDAVLAAIALLSARLPAALNNGCIPADVQRINDTEVVGTGTSNDKWRA